MKIKRLISIVACWLALYTASGQIQWKQVEPGVWKGMVGKPEAYSLLGVSGAAPLKEGFKLLPEVGLPAMASGVVREDSEFARRPLWWKRYGTDSCTCAFLRV